MVDRLFALFQSQNPNSYLTPQVISDPNFWLNSGQMSSPTAGLKPFKKDSSGDLWTSDDVVNWETFGYNYPEFPDGWTAASVRAEIDKLYGDDEDASITATSQALTSFGGLASILPRDSEDATELNAYDWYINVHANKYALRQPYNIFAFFGDAGDPEDWITSDNLAGFSGVSSRILTEDQALFLGPVLISSVIPLNRGLKKKIEAGELKGNSIWHINEYLRQNLNWIVQAVRR